MLAPSLMFCSRVVVLLCSPDEFIGHCGCVPVNDRYLGHATHLRTISSECSREECSTLLVLPSKHCCHCCCWWSCGWQSGCRGYVDSLFGLHCTASCCSHKHSTALVHCKLARLVNESSHLHLALFVQQHTVPQKAAVADLLGLGFWRHNVHSKGNGVHLQALMCSCYSIKPCSQTSRMYDTYTCFRHCGDHGHNDCRHRQMYAK